MTASQLTAAEEDSKFTEAVARSAEEGTPVDLPLDDFGEDA